MAQLKFGTLGAARITPTVLVDPVSADPEVEITVVAARDRARGEEFAARHGIGRVASSYEAVLGDAEIEAVYVPLPVTHHCEWTIRALEAGKHVLTEKAFCANAIEARRMADAARTANRVCIEAFHYRYHPMWARLLEIVGSGILGEIERVEGAFDNFDLPDEGWETYKNPEVGGGSMMHLGCYPVSWLRHILDEEPEVTSAEFEPNRFGADARLEGEVRYPSGATGHFRGWLGADAVDMSLTVTGSKGRLHAVNPLAPQAGHSIEVTTADGTQKEEADMRSSYRYQLDVFKDAVRNGTPLATDAEDAVQQMEFIDAAFRAAGRVPYGLDA